MYYSANSWSVFKNTDQLFEISQQRRLELVIWPINLSTLVVAASAVFSAYIRVYS